MAQLSVYTPHPMNTHHQDHNQQHPAPTPTTTSSGDLRKCHLIARHHCRSEGVDRSLIPRIAHGGRCAGSRICPAQHLDRLRGVGAIDPRFQPGWSGGSRFPRPDLLNVSAGEDPGSPVPGCVRAYCGGVGPVDGGVCRMYIRVMGVDGVGRKRCPRCGKSLRLEAFARNRSRRDGRGSYCRECEAVRWRQREARRRQQGRPSRAPRAKGRTLDELLSEW